MTTHLDIFVQVHCKATISVRSMESGVLVHSCILRTQRLKQKAGELQASVGSTVSRAAERMQDKVGKKWGAVEGWQETSSTWRGKCKRHR